MARQATVTPSKLTGFSNFGLTISSATQGEYLDMLEEEEDLARGVMADVDFDNCTYERVSGKKKKKKKASEVYPCSRSHLALHVAGLFPGLHRAICRGSMSSPVSPARIRSVILTRRSKSA